MTSTRLGPQHPLDALWLHIRRHGPIPAVRVSSAQARGAAKQYAYWGAVRYEIRLRKSDETPTAVAIERASSDRRSRDLADDDACDISVAENRVKIDDLGEISTVQAIAILAAVQR